MNHALAAVEKSTKSVVLTSNYILRIRRKWARSIVHKLDLSVVTGV
jgi:hypothetical protein